MAKDPHDLTQPADLAARHGTGPVRTRRPEYIDLLPTCSHACPAGEQVQVWLGLAQAGQHREAWEVILRDNPFPAIHGRVCYHPCEPACNRESLDGAVSIHAVERYLGDRAMAEGWLPAVAPPAGGGRVLVVGAGPSGLSAAWHLALLGHAVHVHDAGGAPGGMMRYGIPAYRLPRDVLDGEIDRLRRIGVRIEQDRHVSDLGGTWQEGGFDAVFVAVGAHLSKRTEIPARDAGRVLDAVPYLRGVAVGSAPKLGRRVAIYGGGNTAMDAARTAVRLGHEPIIVYRRDRAHMPAHDFEAQEAVEEGVEIHWLRTIRSIEGPTMTVEVMELDESGRPHGTGKFETLEADDLILALGQETDTAFLRSVDGVVFDADGSVVVDATFMTGRPGLFAGGDMVPAERSVTVAVGHGKHAARHIDAWLRGTPWVAPAVPEMATFAKLNLWYYTDIAHRPEPRAGMARRVGSFGEVVKGLTEAEAVFEAKRCLSCGTCFECDGCLAACPEDAVIKLGPGKRYRFDYDLCTGCAACFEQCPCGAISMQPEPERVR
jgi:NADPH-dependent glutamate synthase beta subunit-like oxidoreductase